MSDSPKDEKPANWNLWARAKLTATEYLAVFISGAGFVVCALLTMLAVGIAMTSWWVAYDANENAKVTTMWVRGLHADLKAQGFKPPPLPEEIREDEE